MKKLFAAVTTLMLITVSATMAENIPFIEWLEQQAAVAEQPVVQDELLVAEGTPLAADTAAKGPSTEVSSSEAAEGVLPEFAPIGMGSRGIYVEKLQEKLNELGIPAGKSDGRFGQMTEAALKTVQKALGWEETGVVETEEEFYEIMGIEPGDGVNHAVQTSSEWSEWLVPEYNSENIGFTAAYAYLGEKKVGDYITCQIEIEFASVSPMNPLQEGRAFNFNAQGQVDGEWVNWNLWNNSLIHLTEAPADGVYRFISSQRISEENKNATQFRLGFRCDNWGSGSFRYRCVKVEKGIAATDWSIAPGDVGDGVNLAVESSSEWSDWIAPEYGAENQGIVVTNALLGEKNVGDSYTCQIEIEYSGVTAYVDAADERRFNFNAQGPVDNEWTDYNIWNNSLVHLTQAPEDGVYKYLSTSQISRENKDSSLFRLSFRCDNWASGTFRFRCVKVEKGTLATEWSPSLPSTIDELG